MNKDPAQPKKKKKKEKKKTTNESSKMVIRYYTSTSNVCVPAVSSLFQHSVFFFNVSYCSGRKVLFLSVRVTDNICMLRSHHVFVSYLYIFFHEVFIQNFSSSSLLFSSSDWQEDIVSVKTKQFFFHYIQP